MTTGFLDFVRSTKLYVDKTLLIKEFMEDTFQVVSVLRPRRFGKSVNLSMLQDFLSVGAVSENFQSFAINKHEKFCEQHLGKYPVILLDLKDCKGSTWEAMYSDLWRIIQEIAAAHFEALESYFRTNDDLFNVTCPGQPAPADQSFVVTSLRLISEALHKVHGRKVIILIDEYDTPLNHAFHEGFYEEASKFFSRFFTSALKGNKFLEKAFLAGILEIRGSGIMSGLNNVRTCSVAEVEYSKWFGFNEQEVQKLLLSFFGSDDLLSATKDWYNGYHIGGELMMNPWSIMCCLSRKEDDRFLSYWTNTSARDSLQQYVGPHSSKLLDAAARLVEGDEIAVASLSTEVNYSLGSWELDSILHFLALCGYLSYRKEIGGEKGFVRIPNKDVNTEWKRILPLLFQTSTRSTGMSNEIFSSLKDRDFPKIRRLIERIFMKLSFYDLIIKNNKKGKRFGETVYHVAVSSAFITAADNAECLILSNTETNPGRCDLMAIFESDGFAIVFEFKVSMTPEDLENDSKVALLQIREKKYLANYPHLIKYHVGVSFHGKLVSELQVEKNDPVM